MSETTRKLRMCKAELEQERKLVTHLDGLLYEKGKKIDQLTDEVSGLECHVSNLEEDQNTIKNLTRQREDAIRRADQNLRRYDDANDLNKQVVYERDLLKKANENLIEKNDNQRASLNTLMARDREQAAEITELQKITMRDKHRIDDLRENVKERKQYVLDALEQRDKWVTRYNELFVDRDAVKGELDSLKLAYKEQNERLVRVLGTSNEYRIDAQRKAHQLEDQAKIVVAERRRGDELAGRLCDQGRWGSDEDLSELERRAVEIEDAAAKIEVASKQLNAASIDLDAKLDNIRTER